MYRYRHLTDDERAAPDPDCPADDLPREIVPGTQPEYDLVHWLPPIHLGERGIALEAGQIGDDPQLCTAGESC